MLDLISFLYSSCYIWVTGYRFNMMGGGANGGTGAGPLGAPANTNPLAALMGG